MERADIAVIGAGPQGLAVLAALAARAESWPARVVVIDPAGTWCAAWDAKLARLALDRLRSPQVHHPGPVPMALRDLVEARPETERLALRRPEDERVPTPRGMRRLIDTVVDTLGPIEWLRTTATRLTPTFAESLEEARVIVETADGRSIDAAAAVLANAPSLPRIPGWAADLVEQGYARHASEVDLRAEPGFGDVPKGQLALDLPAPDPAERHVAVVGGGLTAGTLACEVVRRGGRATLLSRRPLRARPYDVDAAWLGPRRLDDFRESTVDQRRRLIDEARDGGTMPERVLLELRKLTETPGSGLVIREAVDVEGELRQLLAEAGIGGTDDANPTLRPEDLGGPAGYFAPPIDAVWLATGFCDDVRADPLVAPLIDRLELSVLGGLPVVTDDLRLPGAPIFVVGPYAALAVGPASRNLAGSRPAAARIAAALAQRSVPTG